MKKKLFFAIRGICLHGGWLQLGGRINFMLILFLTSCKEIIHPLNEIQSGHSSSTTSTVRPNVILIVGDDVGYEVLTCNGGQSYQTLNLDNLAARGRRFTECHASPLCSPSRFALLTGKYNFRNYTEWGKMDTSNRTIGNMFRDAGYSTCYAGKWQLKGYDASIRALGWQKYSVWQPGTEADAGSRYKNPHIYRDGNFLADSATLNKYGEDIFTDYIKAFIDTAKKPYFVYYSMALCHNPMSPTPDDPEFASWDPASPPDPKFFPSMIKYMDKKIGEILSRIDNNTVVIFVGDNGTSRGGVSLFNGTVVNGGKGTTTEYGTHVPLILFKPGTASLVDSSLVDFTDFLPTLAKIARISLPANYGTLDGTPFFPLQSSREWLYYHYNPHPDKGNQELSTWVQNKKYKKYDTCTSDLAKKSAFFNINVDPLELNPISAETQKQKSVDSSFRSIIQFYARQQ